MLTFEQIAEFDMLARYVTLTLGSQPQQQALILRKLGKLFAELHPDFKDDELLYPYLRDNARSWLAYRAEQERTQSALHGLYDEPKEAK